MATFHPGAAKFFMLVALWKEAHKVAQKERLADLEKPNNPRSNYVEEAPERMIKTAKG